MEKSFKKKRIRKHVTSFNFGRQNNCHLQELVDFLRYKAFDTSQEARDYKIQFNTEKLSLDIYAEILETDNEFAKRIIEEYKRRSILREDGVSQ